MNFAEKSVAVTGNLQNGPLSYVCYPTNEFSQSRWLVAINSVVFDSVENISKTCSVSCNFVTGKKRSGNGEIEIYQEPLNIFHLKTSPTAPRGVFRFCKLSSSYKFISSILK